jgi:CO/xanthine dehydrogenase Mo-binding subunit
MSGHAAWASSRRGLLRGSAALVVVCAVPAVAGDAGRLKDPVHRPPLSPDQLDSFIAIGDNGRCTAFLGKVDVGQGIAVAIAQIVADELDMDLAHVDVVLGDTAFTVDQGGASGSFGVSRGGATLRLAAAEARRILVERAAARLGVPAQRILTAVGRAAVQGRPGRSLAYADLLEGRYFETILRWNGVTGNRLESRGTAKPKPPSAHRVVGTSPPRGDIADNVFAEKTYVTDVRLPGMLHARVLRPSAVGATLVSVDERSVAGIAGTSVIREGDVLAVLNPDEWSAIRAARMLKAEWDEPVDPLPDPERLYDYLRAVPAVRRNEEKKVGDLERAFASATQVLACEYEWPFQSHASMVAACAVADVTSRGATVWTGSQKPHAARTGVARLLGLPPERVRAIWVPGPGSYGRNDAGDAALEAAFLSQRAGRPVRLQYSREQGTGWDPKAPASVHSCKAALDETGGISAYHFESRGFSRWNVAPAEADPRDTLVGQLLGLGENSQQAFSFPTEPYDFPVTLLAWETVAPLVSQPSPLRTSHMRDPTGLQIGFASESFIDELAFAADADPVEYRLRHLKDARARAVLEQAAKLFGWQPRRPPTRAAGKLRGQGIGLAARYDTLCAAAVEIEVDAETGRIRPVRWAVAHDCGLIINPDNLRLTIEGNIIQATSRSLCEEVRFDRRTVTSVDWATYPIVEISDLPERIDIALLDRPDVPSGGAGEPASRPVPSALANALFNATGARLRRAPLTAQRVRNALHPDPASSPSA